MDISSFLGGNFLGVVDLPTASIVWHPQEVKVETVGAEQKLTIRFQEHAKSLPLNKTNLRSMAEAFSKDSTQWINQGVEVYKSKTDFQGQMVDCIRLRPSQPTQQSVVLQSAHQPSAQPPVHPPVQPPQQQPAPWEA